MTREQFIQLPEQERKLFIAKLTTAILWNDECFKHAEYVVVMSEKDGKYNATKYFNEKEKL